METQDLTVEIETSDTALSAHTEKRIYYIHVDPDGVEAAEAFEASTVIETSVHQASLPPLEIGTYRVWAESLDASGNKCISPAFSIPVEARGTVRLS